MPDIAICMPVYNASAHLDLALSSLLQQTPAAALSVFAIDDGSTDTSWQVLQRIAMTDTRLRCFRQDNAGAAATRNRCLQMVDSRWVMFFDADDYLYPGSLAAMHDVANRCPQHVIASPWTKFVGAPCAGAHPWATSIQPDSSGVDWILQRWLRTSSCTYPGSFMLPTELARSAPWNESLSVMDDMPYFTRAIVHSPGVCMARGALFAYREPGGANLSNQAGLSHARSALAATQEAVRALIGVERSQRTGVAAANQLMLFAYSHYLDYPSLAEIAVDEANALGIPDLGPPGGTYRQLLFRLLGWRKGLSCHRWLRARLPWKTASSK